MKNKILYFLLIILFSAFQCDEDEYRPDNIIENSDLIEIENTTGQFSVNDYIFIKTKIDNQQTSIENRSVNLTDFLIGNERSLSNSLGLFKLSPDNEQLPYIIENVQILDGNLDFNSESPFFYLTSKYDASTDSFSSQIGIQLTEPGNYVLLPDTYSDNKYQVIFDLNGSAAAGSVQLKTSILRSDNEGIYRFTVE